MLNIPPIVYETIKEICKFCEQFYYTLLDKEITKIKVLDLNKFYNF